MQDVCVCVKRIFSLKDTLYNVPGSESQSPFLPFPSHQPNAPIFSNVTFFFLKKFFIVIQLQLSAFSPHPSTHPSQTHLPPLLPRPPLVLSMCPL